MVERMVPVPSSEGHQVEGGEGELVPRVTFNVFEVAEGKPAGCREHVAMGSKEHGSQDGGTKVADQVFEWMCVLASNAHGDYVLVVDFMHVLIEPLGMEQPVTHPEHKVIR